MFRTIFIFSIILLIVNAELEGSVAQRNKNVECAVCQLMGVMTAMKTGANRNVAISHCHRFEGCELAMTDCQMIEIMHAEIQADPDRFTNVNPLIQKAKSECEIDKSAAVISNDITSPQCMLCFLVYDVLKYINYNILDNPMLLTVKNAIAQACAFLNDNLCQALFQPDTFGAIVRGLKDSLGAFYDLIAVQGFNCPAYSDLFGKC